MTIMILWIANTRNDILLAFFVCQKFYKIEKTTNE